MENKELNVFSFGGKDVRTIELDGIPYFVGKDVAEVLGYSNPSEAIIDHVDDEDKLNSKTLSSLGQRGGWLINESGLYSLILSSKLPQAKDFKRWVTSVVLPAIRHTGGFSVGTSLPMLADLSPVEICDIVLKYKIMQEHPCIKPAQLDSIYRLLPLYPTLQYIEIAKLVGISVDTLRRVRKIMGRG